MHKILAAATLVAALGLGVSARAQIILSGNDEKVLFDDDGKPVVSPQARIRCRSSTSATAPIRASLRRCR